MKTAPEVLQALEEKFPGTISKSDVAVPNPFAYVSADAVADICLFLKEDPNLAFDSLMCLSGVDFKGVKGEEDRLEVVYHLFSMQHRHCFVVKVALPREGPSVPTVEKVWAIANWHEREAYDMFGIQFRGHSDFRRILCPDDWEGFPLRKDYEQPETYLGMPVRPTTQIVEMAEQGQQVGTDPFRRFREE
ncbi:MAG: NADH-quinone oxidoreductase subunit C [Terriglobia bacterium]